MLNYPLVVKFIDTLGHVNICKVQIWVQHDEKSSCLVFSHSNALQSLPKLLLLFNHGYNITCESVTWVNTEAIVVTRQKPRKTILLTCYYVDRVKSIICSIMGVKLSINMNLHTWVEMIPLNSHSNWNWSLLRERIKDSCDQLRFLLPSVAGKKSDMASVSNC